MKDEIKKWPMFILSIFVTGFGAIGFVYETSVRGIVFYTILFIAGFMWFLNNFDELFYKKLKKENKS